MTYFMRFIPIVIENNRFSDILNNINSTFYFNITIQVTFVANNSENKPTQLIINREKQFTVNRETIE
jgi:hypothetical protein